MKRPPRGRVAQGLAKWSRTEETRRSQILQFAASMRERKNRTPNPGSPPVGTQVSWVWGFTSKPSEVHLLGTGIDGWGFRLTFCGALAHYIPDNGWSRDHAYGEDAFRAERGPLCQECRLKWLKHTDGTRLQKGREDGEAATFRPAGGHSALYMPQVPAA